MTPSVDRLEGPLPDRSRGTDRGTTLVELVVTVMIMGVVIAPIMAAFASAVRASASRDRAATAETVIQNAADRVNRAPLRCDYTQYARAAAQTEWGPSASSAATVSMSYWVPGATPAATGSWAAGGGTDCTNPKSLVVQRVTITVTSPSGVVRKLQVVKSNV